jgi:acetyl-CoA synthetase
MSDEKTIDALLSEEREFPPSPEFRRQANVSDPAIYEKAMLDRERYWESWAKELEWETPWETILEWNAPYAKWSSRHAR